MDAFFTNLTTFPTLVYTIALGVVLGYWLISMFGLFDLDAFDIEADIEVDAEVGDVGSVAGVLTSLGLTGVPITIVISLLTLNGWLFCYLATMFVPSFPEIISLLQTALNFFILIASFAVSIIFTAQMIKPLKGMFKKINQGPISSTLIGSTCRVRSSRVDVDFGEAACTLDGANLIVKIRTMGEQTFTTGDSVVIISHHSVDNTFQVVSEQEFSLHLNS